LKEIISSKDTANSSFAETDSTLHLRGGDVAITLSRNGQLIGARNVRGEPVSFANGPVLVGGNAVVKEIKHYKEGSEDVVEVNYSGNLNYVKWKMFGSGWLQLEYEYELKGDFLFTGVSFTYPENYVLGARWLGDGPYRVWKNRLQGTNINVWQNAYNNTQTGAAPWIYPEFKGYFGEIAWIELNTVEGKVLVASPEPDLYVRLFDFYGLSGAKPFPDLPPGSISFLDCIPPMGTKLAVNISSNTAVLGPQSEWNHINRTFKRTLYFYFGLPKKNRVGDCCY
jgi:hypothetical protein